MIDIPVECRGTKHFYSLVRILNKQIGLGRWTAHGRPVRKLRRLDVSNNFKSRYGIDSVRHCSGTMEITFKVPYDHGDIGSALALWGE